MKLIDYIQGREILKKFYACVQNGTHTDDFNIITSQFKELEMIEEYYSKDMLSQMTTKIQAELKQRNLSNRDFSEVCNLFSIIGSVLVSIQNSETSDSKVDWSWCSLFFDYARMCSDESVQMIWSKILEKEIVFPGTYFKRTIKVLGEMEKHEFKWFEDFCKYVIDNSYIASFIIDNNSFYPFNQFQSLIDCGLVNSTLGGITLDTNSLLFTRSGNLKITQGKTTLRVYSLTDSGSQLYYLMESNSSPEYLQELKKRLEINKDVKIESISVM